VAAFFFAVFFASGDDVVRATAMLSTRFGYLRPALRARPRASAFCEGVSFRDPFPLCVVRGFARSHGS
jgi:hypothetical protein